jgi:hypothetical protein
MGIESDAVCASQEAGPLGSAVESVVDGDVGSLAFTDSACLTDHVVCLKVAKFKDVRNKKAQYENATYNEDNCDWPTTGPCGSLVMPNMVMTSLYWGWEMNSAIIRM